jgi:hypothetical protein
VRVVSDRRMAIDPLVRFPSRAAFASMVADREYREVTKLRAQALSEAVLQPTTPWPGIHPSR